MVVGCYDDDFCFCLYVFGNSNICGDVVGMQGDEYVNVFWFVFKNILCVELQFGKFYFGCQFIVKVDQVFLQFNICNGRLLVLVVDKVVIKSESQVFFV